MEFVCNANFKGEFKKSIDLHAFHRDVPHSKLCTRPYQLTIKEPCGTLILFGNGKFRTMGCIDELEAAFLAYSYLEKLSPNSAFPSITLQSYTLRYDLGYHVNLEEMGADVPCIYEPELFPALRLKEYIPLSINIFPSGKIMVCGLKDLDRIYGILMHLRWMCEPYQH